RQNIHISAQWKFPFRLLFLLSFRLFLPHVRLLSPGGPLSLISFSSVCPDPVAPALVCRLCGCLSEALFSPVFYHFYRLFLYRIPAAADVAFFADSVHPCCVLRYFSFSLTGLLPARISVFPLFSRRSEERRVGIGCSCRLRRGAHQ